LTIPYPHVIVTIRICIGHETLLVPDVNVPSKIENEVWLGLMEPFFSELIKVRRTSGRSWTHFVREMINIILAACVERDDSPELYRDHRFRTRSAR